MEKISFVVPCYRSENTITSVVEEVKTEMAAHPDYDYEIVLVNDGSSDKSLEIMQKCAENDSRIVIISQENRGELCVMSHFRLICVPFALWVVSALSSCDILLH